MALNGVKHLSLFFQISGALIVFITGLAVADSILEETDRPLSERVSVRTCFGGFSSIVAHVILSYRKNEIWNSLDNVRVAAQKLHPPSTEKNKVKYNRRNTTKLAFFLCQIRANLGTSVINFLDRCAVKCVVNFQFLNAHQQLHDWIYKCRFAEEKGLTKIQYKP